RVSPAGVVLDATPNQLSNSGFLPAIAFGGTDYLVTWSFNGPHALLVSPAGLADSGVIAVSSEFGDGNAAVGYNGESFLVVYPWGVVDGTSQILYKQDVRARRVSAAGAVLDATP